MTSQPPPDPLKPTNQRKESRDRSLRSGKLYFGTFSPSIIDCLVIDLSTKGVRVETPIMTQLPERLDIKIGDAPVRPVRRCWTRGNVIGLEFLDLNK
jgi:PilZ domain